MPKNYQVLDTYGAELLNELKPRREEVSEIQDREEGDLLCYANPEHAAAICAAMNKGPSLDLSDLSNATAVDMLLRICQDTRSEIVYGKRRLARLPALDPGALELQKHLDAFEAFIEKTRALINTIRTTP